MINDDAKVRGNIRRRRGGRRVGGGLRQRGATRVGGMTTMNMPLPPWCWQQRWRRLVWNWRYRSALGGCYDNY